MLTKYKSHWLSAGCLLSALTLSNLADANENTFSSSLNGSNFTLKEMDGFDFKMFPLASAMQGRGMIPGRRMMPRETTLSQSLDCADPSSFSQSIDQEETMNGVLYSIPGLSDNPDDELSAFQAFKYLAQITGSEIQGTFRVQLLSEDARSLLADAVEPLIGELVSCHLSGGAMIESPNRTISVADAYLAKAIGVTLFAPYKTRAEEQEKGLGEGSLFNEEVGPWQEALADLINSIGGVPSNVVELIKYRVENPQRQFRGANIHFFDGPGIRWQPFVMARFFQSDPRSVERIRQILSGFTFGSRPPEEPPVSTPEEPPVSIPEEPPVSIPEEPPVSIPEEPPVSTPEEPPVSIPEEPPVSTPEEPPVSTPEEPPVSPPTTPPVSTPEEPPVSPPTTPPVERPVFPPVTPPVAPPVERPVTGSCVLTEDQRALLDAHNRARATARNCGGQHFPAAAPLTWSCTLGEAARQHTQDMIDNDIFSHRGSDGSSHADRIRRLGYQPRATGENIAMGQRSVDSAMSGWLGSPGHCRGIMNSAYTELGAARIRGGNRNRDYWTAVFATPR